MPCGVDPESVERRPGPPQRSEVSFAAKALMFVRLGRECVEGCLEVAPMGGRGMDVGPLASNRQKGPEAYRVRSLRVGQDLRGGDATTGSASDGCDLQYLVVMGCETVVGDSAGEFGNGSGGRNPGPVRTLGGRGGGDTTAGGRFWGVGEVGHASKVWTPRGNEKR